MSNKIKKIEYSITPSESSGLFHDSRKDVRTLSKMVNLLKDKINELIAEVNTLKEKNNNQ